MNRFFFAILLLYFSNLVFAQQLPLFNNYLAHQSILNPAIINSDFFTREVKKTITGSYRKQWTEQESAPATQTINFDYNSDDKKLNYLTGGYIINDKTGPTSFTGLYGRYGIVMSDDIQSHGLSIGLNVGIVQYRLKSSDLKLKDADDITASTDRMQLYPDAGVGIQYYGSLGNRSNDKYFVGLSIPQLLGLNFDVGNVAGKYAIQRIQHLYLNASIIKYLSDESYLQPSVWVKTAPGTPINADINLQYQLNNSFWFTTGGSTSGALHLDIGVSIFNGESKNSGMKIGYGYDYYFAEYSPYVGASHEVFVSYGF
jgi:type IX secretion system PorP/SprF family membrane protein